MRVLGLVLVGALALTAPTAVHAGSLGPGSYSMPNGWDGDWHRAPGPSRQWDGGPYLLGLGSQRWRLRLSFRRFEVRLGAGVIRSQSVLSLAGSGFGPPSEISYRGLKLSRVPAAFGRFQLRRLTDLPQVAQPSGGLPPVIRPA